MKRAAGEQGPARTRKGSVKMEGSLNRMGYDRKILQEELRKPIMATGREKTSWREKLAALKETGRVALAAAGLFDTTDLDQELGSNWDNHICIC